MRFNPKRTTHIKDAIIFIVFLLWITLPITLCIIGLEALAIVDAMIVVLSGMIFMVVQGIRLELHR